MELKDAIRIDAPRARVFAALNDVDILRQAIPGCEELVAISATEFTAVVSSRIGPLAARFTGHVNLSDIVPPESYTLTGEGKGGPAGHARIRSQVRLVEDGEATLLHYDVRADIGGKLAQLGGSLVEKTSQKLAAEFFRKFEQLVAPTPVEPPAVAAMAPAGTPGLPAWWWLAAAAAALAMLAWFVL